MIIGREVRLVRRPVGTPRLDDFELCEAALAEPGPGEVLIRNLFLSVDPGQRGLMNGRDSYVETYEIGRAMTGRCLGRVIESRVPSLPEGTIVLHRAGWREYALARAHEVTAVEPFPGIALSSYLGVLGHPGLTAWIGITEIAQVGPDDVVLVSSAAGAVGSAAAQLTRTRGARVVGLAGTAAKAEYLRRELGVAEALVYSGEDFAERLRAASPAGFSVYFDNVGGALLDTALERMADHATVVSCGSISTYNATGGYPFRNLGLIAGKRLRLQGFIVYDHEERFTEFRSEVAPLLRDGTITSCESIYDGLAEAPRAFLSLFGHENLGKVLVGIGERS